MTARDLTGFYAFFSSGTEKEPKPKLFGPDIFQWGRGLPRERVGAQKFDTSLETREIKLFGRDIPGFCWDIPWVPGKFEKKKVCVQFPFPISAHNFSTFLGDFLTKLHRMSWRNKRKSTGENSQNPVETAAQWSVSRCPPDTKLLLALF